MRRWGVALAAGALAFCVGPLSAQEEGGGVLRGIHFTVDGLAFRHAANDPEGWRPGGSFAIRVPLTGVFIGELSVGGVTTRRMGGPINPLDSRAFEEYSGHTGIVTLSGGARLESGDWATYTGVGFGRMWDSQPGPELLYGGPIWVAHAELERRLDDLLGVHVAYRILRMGVQNGHWVSQGGHQVHHQVGMGVRITPP